jgi:hypothetical protein
LEFEPMSGADLQKIIAQTLEVPAAVIERSIELAR